MRENIKLAKITGDKAIFVTDGAIIPVEISAEALQVLKYYKKIPINDFIA